MKYYSTNNRSHQVSLKEAVIEGLAPDNGLYMPERIPVLGQEFFNTMRGRPFAEIAFDVSSALIGDDLPSDQLRRIIDHTIQFDAPLVRVGENILALELFHGPTLAFKDFGARFMSQLLGFFASQQKREITILVATSGDTGSAVANGFLGVEGTRVIVLYPAGKVSAIQEKQFTTLGKNITALEVDGTFDDCQRLVKQAFMDKDLKARHFLTSANSINIARLIPQSFYYFYAASQLGKNAGDVVFSVPSGNFGNLTAGLLAAKMGLPVRKFIASTNTNDVVPKYLKTKLFDPRPSDHTISNAMDVGNPSNFARLLDLFGNSHEAMRAMVEGYSFTDEETAAAMRLVYSTRGYIMDPHGAVSYLGLKKYMDAYPENQTGIFLETAHPAKFNDVVDKVLDKHIEIPETLQKFMKNRKVALPMTKDFSGFKSWLQDH